DWPFRYSLINDIIEGILFIHESSLGYHGSLKSSNCVIDSRLVVKLTDIGLRTIRNLSKQNSGLPNYKSLLWTAPEHLRQRRPDLHGSVKGDIYSFSIVLQEIITRSGPFETVKVVGGDGKYSVVSLDPQFIIQQLKLGGATPYRPNVDQRECAPELIELLQQCWDENPQNRPTITTIRTQIRKLSKDYIGGSGNSFLENLLLRLEQYANDLEILVEQKTSAFFEEKRKCEELLYELLPKTVADQLKRENQVKPESFQCVTIFFSDIVQFTQIAAASTPIEIVDFLNDLYTLFDSIIASYDVYKVETVGDSYMVVSGLPIRNGNEHARQIARMSLELLDQIKKFRIKHLPEQDVRLRIGIHSGPCAAGVIGLKMPRYCLFGDTVNTASRMESHGERKSFMISIKTITIITTMIIANKIHTSEFSKLILDRFGSFNLTLRGDIHLKGKGIVRTYWLDNEHNRLLLDRFKFLNKIETSRISTPINMATQQQQQQSFSSATTSTNINP
ncbi:guanylate cyclase C-like protein, partial [Euroglyphus maynei]